MLLKMGDNYPEPEIIQLSEQVIKINAKRKEQKRVLLITDKALYNLIPNSYKQCKRRIPIEKISSITISTSSQQFAIHIPDEYDYLFKSDERARIVSALKTEIQKKGFVLKTFITSDDNMQSSNLLQRKKVTQYDKHIKSSLSLKLPSMFAIGRKNKKSKKIRAHTMGDDVEQHKECLDQLGDEKELQFNLSPCSEDHVENWTPNPLLTSPQSAESAESTKTPTTIQMNSSTDDTDDYHNEYGQKNSNKMQEEENNNNKPSMIEASYSEDAMQEYFAEHGTMPDSMKSIEPTPELCTQYTIDRVQTYFNEHGTMPSQEMCPI